MFLSIYKYIIEEWEQVLLPILLLLYRGTSIISEWKECPPKFTQLFTISDFHK